MSYLYDEYLHDHIEGVQKAYGWLVEHHLVPADAFVQDLAEHDASKRTEKEYEAYDKYFYGGNKSFKVVQDFNYAWLHHIHHNPHHWQYWVLQHDDEPEETLEMPKNRVIEMICDWWSFSWKSGNLGEIFDWYEKHKDMKLHEKTREMVEDILGEMHEILDEENHLEHHGIKGQKWGVQNGPPYPLNSETLADKLYSEAKEREPGITRDVSSAAKEAGSKLYGLEHKLKTKESIQRKIETDSEEKGISISDAAMGMKDLVRYSTLTPDDIFVDGYERFKSSMQNAGYEETRCRNYFEMYKQGKVKHKSVQSVFATEDGYQFEVQFQTPASQHAKNEKIPIYEERRKPSLSKERQAELERQMEKLAEDVTEPKDISRIKSH